MTRLWDTYRTGWPESSDAGEIPRDKTHERWICLERSGRTSIGWWRGYLFRDRRRGIPPQYYQCCRCCRRCRPIHLRFHPKGPICRIDLDREFRGRGERRDGDIRRRIRWGRWRRVGGGVAAGFERGRRGSRTFGGGGRRGRVRRRGSVWWGRPVRVAAAAAVVAERWSYRRRRRQRLLRYLPLLLLLPPPGLPPTTRRTRTPPEDSRSSRKPPPVSTPTAR
mmetsp:Transcript_8714/g.18297  ORF Transcript_8714/g.18297 Transcript_8714/m.18297 type:complete len:222 (-) Transcript_8714:91-756(-)